MYGVLAVGLQYPQELLERVCDRHGQDPTISVVTGRRGF